MPSNEMDAVYKEVDSLLDKEHLTPSEKEHLLQLSRILTEHEKNEKF